MGNVKASGMADITVASIKSLVSKDRMHKFDPRRFKLVLVDEAHHVVARSYRQALDHFGLSSRENDDAATNATTAKDSPVLVGVSATFSRFDGVKLGAAIDHIVYHKDYVDMIDDDWLANAVFTTVRSEADLSRVKRDRFGDFAAPSLSRAVNTDRSNNITVRAWLANAADKRKSTLVFCVDVNHVRQLTATFRQHGIDARYVTSKTPRDVRGEQLRAFRNGEFPVLVNCGLFTEGTDIPNIDCVLLARPTRSKNLLVQMIGRGLRLYPGKKDCHIIDMVATLQAGVISTPTLFGLHPDQVLDGATMKDKEQIVSSSSSSSDAQQNYDDDDDDLSNSNNTMTPSPQTSITFTKYESIFDLLDDTKPERYIRSISPNAWIRADETKYVLSGASGWLSIERERVTMDTPEEKDMYMVRYVGKFRRPESFTPEWEDNKTSSSSFAYTRPRVVATAPDLETAVHAADTYAKNRLEMAHIFTRQAWRKTPATPSQIAILRRTKVLNDDPDTHNHGLTKGQATDMITKLRFGGKKRFAKMQEKLKDATRREARRKEFQGLLSRTDVKIGPVDA